MKIILNKISRADKKEANKVKIIITAVIIIAAFFLILTLVESLNGKSVNTDEYNNKPNVKAMASTTTTSTTTVTTTTTTTTTTVTTTTFVPFETTRVGNKKIGFIEVPKSWMKIEDDNINHDDYLEYAAVYKEEKDNSLAYSSIAIEYGELGEKSKHEFLEAEAKQFSAMDQYFNSDSKEETEIIADDKINVNDYFTKYSINGADAYMFETKIKDYYKDVGYGDGYLTVYIMFLPDNTYRAITVESNTSEKFLTTKLISTYTLK